MHPDLTRDDVNENVIMTATGRRSIQSLLRKPRQGANGGGEAKRAKSFSGIRGVYASTQVPIHDTDWIVPKIHIVVTRQPLSEGAVPYIPIKFRAAAREPPTPPSVLDCKAQQIMVEDSERWKSLTEDERLELVLTPCDAFVTLYQQSPFFYRRPPFQPNRPSATSGAWQRQQQHNAPSQYGSSPYVRREAPTHSRSTTSSTRSNPSSASSSSSFVQPRGSVPPAHYVCHCCGVRADHYILNCPQRSHRQQPRSHFH